jgi:hypothetical protein
VDTLSPALADAYQLLRQDIYGYLDEADELSLRDRQWGAEEEKSARDLISNLTLLVRAVLADHRESTVGVCRNCNSRWPCLTVRSIHGLVKDPEGEFIKIARRNSSR